MLLGTCGLDELHLILHMGVTLYETILSFLLVIAAASSSPCCLWFSPRLCQRSWNPYLVVLNSLPKSALAPLLIVWLGASMRHHHRGGHVGGHLWQHFKPVRQLRHCEPGGRSS